MSNVVWGFFVVYLVATFYVNHYMPHAPMIDTGDVVCRNDGRGPCEESYIEDTRYLNIPDWAKFLRRDGRLLFFALPILALYLKSKSVNGEPEIG